MPAFGERSRSRLEQVHPLMRQLMERVVEVIDITVLTGHRTRDDQTEAYNTGKSKLQWPDSKHNQLPSSAVDIAPYPIPTGWKPQTFYYVAGVVKAEAHHMGLKIRWGGDWDGDDDLHDQTFNDLVHFELKG